MNKEFNNLIKKRVWDNPNIDCPINVDKTSEKDKKSHLPYFFYELNVIN